MHPEEFSRGAVFISLVKQNPKYVCSLSDNFREIWKD